MPTNFFTSKLQGKRIVIIGGTSGIGFAVAQGCLEFGASVIVASSSQSRVDEAQVRLRESGDASRISGYTIDLRGGSEGIPGIESRMYKFLVEQVKEPFDHFVFTAGDKMHLATIAEVDLVKVSENQDVRYWAPYAAIKIMQKHSLLKEGGSITLTGGVNDIRPHPGWAGTTSAALFTLAKLVSVEMAPLRCNVVVPGPVKTELWERLPGSTEAFKVIEKKTTIKGIPGPHETAEAYLYCMRDRSFTGQTIITEAGTLLA